MTSTVVRVAIAVLLVPAVWFGANCAPTVPEADPTNTTVDARLYAVGSQPFERSYGQWAAAWWQWIVAIPKAESPNLDATGEYQDTSQTGSVWFLGGANSSDLVTRTITVPADTALFFPIINSWSRTPVDGTTEQDLRNDQEGALAMVAELEVQVDGDQLTGLTGHACESPVFEFTGDEDELFEGTEGEHTALTTGYYVMLKPLSSGQHTVYFRGRLVVPGANPDGSDFVFEPKVTYNITVE